MMLNGKTAGPIDLSKDYPGNEIKQALGLLNTLVEDCADIAKCLSANMLRRWLPGPDSNQRQGGQQPTRSVPNVLTGNMLV